MIAELEDQQGKIRELNEEMEAYKAQQEELDEQRRRADELQRQFEETRHASEEEKAQMVGNCFSITVQHRLWYNEEIGVRADLPLGMFGVLGSKLRHSAWSDFIFIFPLLFLMQHWYIFSIMRINTVSFFFKSKIINVFCYASLWSVKPVVVHWYGPVVVYCLGLGECPH